MNDILYSRGKERGVPQTDRQSSRTLITEYQSVTFSPKLLANKGVVRPKEVIRKIT